MCLGNNYWATKQRKSWVSLVNIDADIRNLMHRRVHAFVNHCNKNCPCYSDNYNSPLIIAKLVNMASGLAMC